VNIPSKFHRHCSSCSGDIRSWSVRTYIQTNGQMQWTDRMQT